MDLASRRCTPCRGGVPPLDADQVAELRAALGMGWDMIDGRRLAREFAFPDFASALAFVNRVGGMADEQDHHPEVQLAWGRVRIEIWTHTIDGLTESDFVFAARCDRLFEPA